MIEKLPENIRKDVNGLSLSWGVGGGIEYELSPNAVVVAGLYFQQQFTDMTDDGGSVFDSNASTWKKEDSKGAFNALSVRIGFMFLLLDLAPWPASMAQLRPAIGNRQ